MIGRRAGVPVSLAVERAGAAARRPRGRRVDRAPPRVGPLRVEGRPRRDPLPLVAGGRGRGDALLPVRLGLVRRRRARRLRAAAPGGDSLGARLLPPLPLPRPRPPPRDGSRRLPETRPRFVGGVPPRPPALPRGGPAPGRAGEGAARPAVPPPLPVGLLPPGGLRRRALPPPRPPSRSARSAAGTSRRPPRSASSRASAGPPRRRSGRGSPSPSGSRRGEGRSAGRRGRSRPSCSSAPRRSSASSRTSSGSAGRRGSRGSSSASWPPGRSA